MKIEYDDYGRAMVYYPAAGAEPLNIPLSDITTDAALAEMISNHIDDLPNDFASRILLPGLLDTTSDNMVLGDICTVLIGLVDLLKTAGENSDEFVLSFKFKDGVLNVVMGRLNFMLGPDTLISETAGNA